MPRQAIVQATRSIIRPASSSAMMLLRTYLFTRRLLRPIPVRRIIQSQTLNPPQLRIKPANNNNSLSRPMHQVGPHQETTTTPEGRINHHHSAGAHVKQATHGDSSTADPSEHERAAETVGQVNESNDANARKIAGDGQLNWVFGRLLAYACADY